MTTQDALNGIYMMLSTIVELQNTKANNNSNTSETDLTIVSLLKGIIETNSAENIQSTGQALESLAKGVAAFDDVTKGVIKDVSSALLSLNNSLMIIHDAKGLSNNVDDLLELFNKLGSVKEEDAKNFTRFIELLSINDGKRLNESNKILLTSLLFLNLIVDINVKKLIKNLKYLGKNKRVASSIGEFILELHNAISSKNILDLSKNTAQAISTLLGGIANFANVNIWNLMKAFNPITAWVIGKALSVFLKQLQHSLSASLNSEELKNISEILKPISKIGEVNMKTLLKNFDILNALRISAFFNVLIRTLPNNKESIIASDNISIIIEAFAKISKDNIKAIKYFANNLTEKRADKIVTFIKKICEGLSSIKLEDLKKIDTVFSAFNHITYSMLITFGVLAVMITILPVTSIITASILLKLGIKLIKNTILSLVDGLKEKDIKDATGLVSSISIMMLTLTGSLVILTLIAKSAKLTDIALGIVMMATVVGAGLFIVNYIQKLADDKNQIDNTRSTIYAISLLFLSISVSLSLLLLTVKSASQEEILYASGIIIGFLSISYVMVWGLSKIKKDVLSRTTAALLTISAVYAIIALVSVTLIIPIGKQAGPIIIGNSVVLGTIVLMIGLVALLAISSKTIESGLYNMGLIVLMYTAVSIVINLLIIPIGKQIIPASLGTLTVLVTLVALIGGISLLAKIKMSTIGKSMLTLAAISLILITTSLIIKDLIIPIGELKKNAWNGLAVVGVILASMLIILSLVATASKTITDSFMPLVELSLAAVLISISVGIISLVAIKAGEADEKIWNGLGVIVAIYAGTLAIVYILGKFKKETLIQGAIALTGLSVIIGLLGVCLEPIINVAIKAGQEKGVLAGLGIVSAIIVATGVLIAGVGAVVANPVVATILLAGAAAFAGLSLAILSISGIVNLVINMVKSVQGYNEKIFTDASKTLVSLFTMVYDVVYAATPNLLQAAALVAAPIVMLDLLAVIAGVKSIANTINRLIKEISALDIITFKNIVIGEDGTGTDINSMLGSMNAIVKAVAGFDGYGKAMLISYALRPVLNTLSQFIDIIKKVATLSYISGYDDNGKPIFDHLNPSVFKDAAVAVSDGFGTFLDILDSKFTLSLASSLLLVGLIGRTLNPIVDTVSKFVDIVIKVAKMLIVTGYDDNGKPIFEHVPVETFSEAANKVSALFGDFIDILGSKMNNMSNRSLYVIDSIKKTMKPVMLAVATFVDTVIKVATLLIVTGYDDNGKPIYELIKPEVFGDAASKVSYYFGDFLLKLNENMGSLSDKTINAMNSIKKSIAPVMKGISHFVDAIVKLATALIPDKWDEEGKPIHFKEVTPDLYILAALTISVTFGIFLDLITENFDANFFTSKTESALKAISNNIEPVMEGITKWTEAIYKLATGVIEYDTWDDKSKKYIKITEKIDSESYREAAKVITESFTSFILTLTKYLTGDIQEQAKNLKDVINDSINPIMDAVLKFSKALEPFLNIQDKNEKNINAKYLAAKPDFVKNIATEIATSFVEFIRIIATEFANETNQENYKSIATITPTINKVLDHISKSSTKLRNIIKSLTDDNNKVLKNGTEVAAQFIASLNAFVKSGDEKTPGLKDANTYYNAYDVYKTYINPLLSEAIRSAKFINNIVLLIHNEELSYKGIIDNFNSIIESITSKSISVHTRIKDIDFTQIRSMADTYQHIALKFTLISHYMNVNKDLTTGIDIFISNLDRLTNKEINANIIATGGNIKIYVEQLDSFTSLIKTTVKEVKIYVTELDKAREALEALDKQIIDNEKARNNALLSFADKINNITDAVNNLKDSFNALNENKILSQFNNIRNLLNTINSDIEESNNKEVNLTVNKSVNNPANTQPVLNGKNTVNNVHTPILANNVKVEFIIDNRVIPGFMNIVPK